VTLAGISTPFQGEHRRTLERSGAGKPRHFRKSPQKSGFACCGILNTAAIYHNAEEGFGNLEELARFRDSGRRFCDDLAGAVAAHLDWAFCAGRFNGLAGLFPATKMPEPSIDSF
jgi:hypothetical protein